MPLIRIPEEEATPTTASPCKPSSAHCDCTCRLGIQCWPRSSNPKKLKQDLQHNRNKFRLLLIPLRGLFRLDCLGRRCHFCNRRASSAAGSYAMLRNNVVGGFVGPAATPNCRDYHPYCEQIVPRGFCFFELYSQNKSDEEFPDAASDPEDFGISGTEETKRDEKLTERKAMDKKTEED
uniref:Uncharacterized protein n=1 Tax=Globodera rostochiensis TaxID=31243 RepID=A0A914HNT4_GLORO